VRVALRALRKDWAIDPAWLGKTATCDAADPGCGVGGVDTANDDDAELGNRQKDTADSLRRQWAVVEHRPFHDKVLPRRGTAQVSDLSPEPTLDYGDVQIRNGFPLDQRGVVDRVIADFECSFLDSKVESSERGRYAASALVNVGNYAHLLSMLGLVSRSRDPAATFLSTSDFAGL
jgi:hypothetical protein